MQGQAREVGLASRRHVAVLHVCGADAELRQRNRTLSGSNEQPGGSDDVAEASSSGQDTAEARIPVSEAVLAQREYYLTVQVQSLELGVKLPRLVGFMFQRVL